MNCQRSDHLDVLQVQAAGREVKGQGCVFPQFQLPQRHQKWAAGSKGCIALTEGQSDQVASSVQERKRWEALAAVQPASTLPCQIDCQGQVSEGISPPTVPEAYKLGTRHTQQVCKA